MTGQDDALDEALRRLEGTGPEFGGGLSNHGPMVSEALVRLHRAEDVERWLDNYVERLEPAPGNGRRIAPGEWSGALGLSRWYPDWVATAQADLEERPWPAVLGGWLLRLVPGAAAAAMHGVIRTAHATRALEQADSPERRHELAAGLAYWAASYEELPGRPTLSGARDIASVLEGVSRLDPARRTDNLISDDVRLVAEVGGFAESVDELAAPDAVAEALSELTRVMAHWYLANADVRPVAFVHGVTGPAALRLLLPYLSEGSQEAAFGYVWQVCVALVSTCAEMTPDTSLTRQKVARQPEDPRAAGQDTAPAEIVDEAISVGGAHGIKLIEACFREDAIAPDPVYARAAADGGRRLPY